MSAALPTISHDFDLATGRWHLFATSYGVAEPAGARLLKGGHPPAIKFEHDNEADAIEDARRLAEYISTSWPKKAMSKARLRKEGA